MKIPKGFSLIELMITVTILFIMALIAVPSWTKLIQDNAITTAVNQIQSIYQLTRSEALKRHEDITLTSTNTNHSWTMSTSSGALKTMTLSTDKVSITPLSGSDVSITVTSTGFAENKKLEFSWENEYRCLTIYSSGQSKVSSNSEDCNS